MSKHVLDRPKVVTNEMLRRAVAIRRKALPQVASLKLQRRHRGEMARMRLRHFLRIERNAQVKG